jgi:hypothetical protein
VFVEVVAELALGYEHGIEQLLELWAANIGVGECLTDVEVYGHWTLVSE